MHIQYISWLPSRLGMNQEDIDIRDKEFTLENLMDLLAQKNTAFKQIFQHKNVIFASRDGEMVDRSDILNNDDNIIFFSPIAGG